MELTHRFHVPTGVEETWAAFEDIASVAECFPGATVTAHDGDTFEGTCKVKLGPIALLYQGSGTFVEKDESAHRFVVDAKGKDKRGNGTAGAKVTLEMAEAAAAGTDVAVFTDLSITGKPAQFGRGVMQDVSDKLLGQFVTCLEHRLGADEEPAAPAPQAEAPESVAPTAPVEPAEAAAAPTDESPPPPRTSAPKQDDAINLGSTVLPVLARTYWKHALVVLVLVALVIWLIAR
jgi:uncharacterized protein